MTTTHPPSRPSSLTLPHVAAKHIGFIVALGSAAWVLKFALAVGLDHSPDVEFITRILTAAGALSLIGFAWGITHALVQRAGLLARIAVFIAAIGLGVGLAVVLMTATHAVAHQLLPSTPHDIINELPGLLVGIAGLVLAPLFWIEWEG